MNARRKSIRTFGSITILNGFAPASGLASIFCKAGACVVVTISKSRDSFAIDRQPSCSAPGSNENRLPKRPNDLGRARPCRAGPKKSQSHETSGYDRTKDLDVAYANSEEVPRIRYVARALVLSRRPLCHVERKPRHLLLFLC